MKTINNLKIVDYSHEGYGIGKHKNDIIFVKYAHVGERYSVEIDYHKNKIYYASILEQLPKVKCADYYQCGGCNVMHLDYQEQLAFKENVVKNIMRKNKIKGTIKPIVASEQWGYRNKVQLPFGIVNGQIHVGLYKEKTHQVIDVEYCYLQSKLLNDIADYVVELMNEVGETVYNEDTNKGNLRHLYLRQGFNTDEVMVCFVVKSKQIKEQKYVAKQLTNKFKEITSIVVNENSRRTSAVLGFKNYNLYNSNFLTEKLGSQEYRIAPNGFFQVNTLQAEKLYDLISGYADFKKTDVVLDAYCGAGTIGLYIAHQVKQVVGVDIVSASIENAKKNAKINNLDNTKFICNDIEKEIHNHSLKNYDTIIVDPPRKGLEQSFIKQLLKEPVNKVIYVSCNPATLARDLKQLNKAYKIMEMTPVDMFAQTYHVEVVVKLEAWKG